MIGRSTRVWATDPCLSPLLSLLLERHLLNLDTRLCMGALKGFWQWVTSDPKSPPELKALWDQYDKAIRGTMTPGDLSFEKVEGQERDFVRILEKSANDLWLHGDRFGWAYSTVNLLIERRRRPTATPLDHAYARVVFVWTGHRPKEMRPAILLELQLINQRTPGTNDPWVERGGMFGPSFHEAVQTVVHEIGEGRFHRLAFQPSTGGQEQLMRTAETLTGASGGLAIYVAEQLANRRTRGRDDSYAMPPWFVISATLDESANGLIKGVDALTEKIALLREEGVRVVGVADDRNQVADARRSAGPE